VTDVLESLTFFQGLTPAELGLLRYLFTPCDYFSSAQLFEQGDAAEYLYIVVTGEVIVRYKPDDGPPLVVTHVYPGGIVGWSAALGSKAYTSGAEAVCNTHLLRVRGTDLRNLCEQYPATGNVILDRLAGVIAERLRNTHPQVKAMLESALLVHSGG